MAGRLSTTNYADKRIKVYPKLSCTRLFPSFVYPKLSCTQSRH